MAETAGESATKHDPVPDDALWQQAGTAFERYRTGETRAMDELVRLLTPVLWQVVRAYGLDRTQAEDVLQTTWLTVVRRHHAVREPRAISSWVIVTARREAWRMRRGSGAPTPVDDGVLAARTPRVGSAEASVVLDEAHRQLWDAVAALDERCRLLLRVIAFEDRPDYTGLAEELAMPVGSIGPTRGRCLDKLRGTLRARGEGR